MAQFEVASLWNRKSGNLKNYSNSTTKKLITKSSLDYYVCALVLAICLTLNKGFLVDALEHDHTTIFSRHTQIEPKLINARENTAIENTLEKNGLHATHIILKYEHNNKDVILDLQQNDNLIPLEHYLSYQHSNGDKAIKNFTKTEIDLCNYHGKIRHKDHSIVAVSTCNGIRGVVFDGTDTYYIENELNGPQRKHYLIRHSDLKHDHKCGYDGGINKTHDEDLYKNTEFNRILRYKRSPSSSSDNIIRGPYNANKRSSYVELVLVVDNKVFLGLDKNFTKVHQHCKDIANIINALYVPLNIFIALVGVVVWSENNEVELSSDGDKTLKNFLHYRKKVLVRDHPNDNAQLLTKEQFDGGVVGKALKGPICTYEFSGGVSMDHSNIIAIVATTIAHEMGHNFGMEHDTPECKCPDDRCIMSASSSQIAPTHWSACSIDQLNLAFHHGMNHCLKNKPTKLFDSPVCGNGFVEAGEQCDCGLPQYCNNTCCNPYTCMLYPNASCATGECCDLQKCKPKNAGEICRSNNGECDLPEYCTGESEYCPIDVYKRNTEVCDSSEAFCYQGSCRSQNDQCKVLWGPSGKSSEQCYDRNINGSRHGNCGFDRLKAEYLSCRQEDAFCGMLHCRHLNERLEFGMESVAVLSHSFMNYRGSIIPCRTAIVDLGLQAADPGMTPDGAKCGEGKMCVKQKCMAIESLRLSSGATDCGNCNDNGVCNSRGNCHCHDGFAPPFCKEPGVGGSIDSGPASDPNSGRGFTKIMYIFFLGVVPCCAIAAVLIYYWRQNGMAFRKSPTLPNIKHHITKDTGSPQSPTISPSSPNSPDDMNSSLLRPSSDSENNYIFGKFKGFTMQPLKPLPNAGAKNNFNAKVAFVHPLSKNTANELDMHPTREAPPPPIPKHGIQNKISKFEPLHVAPAPPLPPMNKGSTARPIISNPILEGSTCDAKELPLNVKYPTIRPAPAPPVNDTRIPVSSGYEEPIVPDILINPVAYVEVKKPKDGTLSRIQSFLKKDHTSKAESSKNQKQLKALDKEKLKDLQIGSPIMITTKPLKDADDVKNKLNRAQSLRDPNHQIITKPAEKLNSFGSMRANRPKSIVDRPNIPPPPRPPAPPSITGLKIPGVAGYQNPPPPKKTNEYDDCDAVESPITPDNIYSVIEESDSPQSPKSPPQRTLSPPVVASQSGSIESMGLLSEIVNEIEHRNFDSIYIASTLKRKPKPAGLTASYANTDEEEYSVNNVDSNGSTTSSGYLRPSAINAPIARIPPSKSITKMPSLPSGNSLNSFKSAKSQGSSPEEKPQVKPIKFDGPLKKTNSDLSKKVAPKASPEDLENGYKTTISNKPLNDEPKSSEMTSFGTRRPSLKKITTPAVAKPATQSTIRKRSPSPTKTQTTSLVPGSKVTSKPKTPLKPSTISTTTKNSIPSTFSAGKTAAASAVPKAKTTAGLSNGVAKTPASNATTTTNKVLSAAAKPKVSNVALMQQKFESSNKS